MMGPKIYEGKAKIVYVDTDSENQVYVQFKDSLTAFNAQKKGSFSDKGRINLDISEILFLELQGQGILTHWKKRVDATTILAERLEIVPLEVVVRNRLAGSTAKKMGRAEGEALSGPLVEFYFKNDALQDPFLSDDQIVVFQISDEKTLLEFKSLALKINAYLKSLFQEVGLDLIDFKVEFGRNQEGVIKLADEMSPDCMRLWDKNTQEKLDKDRFRRDLGRVEESYREVLRRLEERKRK